MITAKIKITMTCRVLILGNFPNLSHTRAGIFAVKMRVTIHPNATERAELRRIRRIVCGSSLQESASSRKKIVWWMSVRTRRNAKNLRLPRRSGEGIPPSRTFSRPQIMPGKRRAEEGDGECGDGVDSAAPMAQSMVIPSRSLEPRSETAERRAAAGR